MTDHIADTPTEKKKTRRTGRKKADSPFAKFIVALKNISHCQFKSGDENFSFCKIEDKKIIATNEDVVICAPIDEDFSFNPKTHYLIDVLSKCSSDISLTEIGDSALSVVSDRFRAVVPCLPDGLPTDEPFFLPDPSSLPCGEALRNALVMCAGASSGSSDDDDLAIEKSVVYVTQYTTYGTNGCIGIECTHGINFPTDVAIPSKSIKILAKIKDDLVSIGGSKYSITLHFKSGMWVKLRLTETGPIGLQKLMNETVGECGFWFKPDASFYEGVKKVGTTSESGIVYFSNQGITASKQSGNASSFKFDMDCNNTITSYDYKYLVFLEKIEPDRIGIKSRDSGPILYFDNTSCRGVIAGLRNKTDPLEQELDDDIPF